MSYQVVCSSCKKPILWKKTASGALMPLDPVPVAGGNVIIKGDVAYTLKGDLWEEIAAEEPRYVSHFATCANAAQHRKRK